MKTLFLRSQKGMVLVIVIIAVMLMSAVVVGILSRNITSAFVDEKGRQRFQAELLAKGCFWRSYQSNGAVPSSCTETVDGTTYTVIYTAVNAGALGTQILTQVDY
jgi:Tfp pilus assembly protein PilV